MLIAFVALGYHAAVAQINNAGSPVGTPNVPNTFQPPAQPDPVVQPNSSGIQTTTPYEPAIPGTIVTPPNLQVPETGVQAIPGVQQVTAPMQTQPTITNPNTENTGSPNSPPKN